MWGYSCFCIVFSLSCNVVADDGSIIRVGGLFHSINMEEGEAFEEAVNAVNKEGTLGDIKLEPIQELVPELNTFQTGRGACSVLTQGVAAIFGPRSPSSAMHVQSVCDAKEVPHIETRWDALQQRGGCSINLHPHPASLTKALISTIRQFGWHSFAILYENELALSSMSELLQMAVTEEFSLMIRSLGSGDNYRDVLKEVQRSQCKNIVLECSKETLPEVLKQAQQVGLMISHYNYIITNLDLHTLDLDFLKYGGTNITGFGISDMKVSVEDRMPLGTALLYDAVTLFSTALAYLIDTNITSVPPLSCSDEHSWAHGYTVINIMKSSEFKGETGLVKFDNQGFRSDFELNVIELTENGLSDIGKWNTSQGLNITRAPTGLTVIEGEEGTLANKSFIVLIALTAPYGMLKEESNQLTGNDRFEGMGIDLIRELSLMLGFNYTFVVQVDGQYGSLDKKTKQWNGMLREIMDDRADLGISDLTITHDREGAVDFTMPFMNLGISILYKKPQKQPPSLFSFLAPFSREVWMYMLGAYVGVSVLLYVMARISPYEWTNPYPCIEEPEVLENQFSLKNSLWFTIGSLMQQGSDIAPTAVSTRMVAGIWWFFTLIMVSSYTANLAAFLTVEPPYSPFTNVEQLAYNTKGITYGAKVNGSTLGFFQNSDSKLYNDMFSFMDEHKEEVLAKTNEDGLAWVLSTEKDYAFIMESTSIEYITERNCNVSQVGGLLDSKGYGIAMKKNSPYRNLLSSGVLQLQETGRLSDMHRKWWKEKRGGGACSEGSKETEANELDLKNVGGVFVVLVVGVFIAFFITIFEVLWNIGTIARREHVTFKGELIEELKFVAKCHGSTKPVRKYGAADSDEDEDENGKKEKENNNPFRSAQSIANIANFGGWFENNEKKMPLP